MGLPLLRLTETYEAHHSARHLPPGSDNDAPHVRHWPEAPMPSSDAYRRKALELYDRANNEARPGLSIEFQVLAMAYMRHSAMWMPRDLSASRDDYRFKALELCERANEEQELEVRRELESLATAYMRLAEMADRNTLLDPNEDVETGDCRSDSPQV